MNCYNAIVCDIVTPHLHAHVSGPSSSEFGNDPSPNESRSTSISVLLHLAFTQSALPVPFTQWHPASSTGLGQQSDWDPNVHVPLLVSTLAVPLGQLCRL
jgi:hypothetical protein